MTVKDYLLSNKLLKKINAGRLWLFHGGVHPAENKQQSSQHAIKDAGIAPYLVFSIEHKGEVIKCLVEVGDQVLKGQALTKVEGSMVVQHASSSGKVIAIEPRTDLHPSGLPVMSVVIKTDGLDRPINYQECDDYSAKTTAQILNEIQQAGIIGLGGAGFPTHVKLSRASNIKLLIINGAECEPYITSDDRLMQENAREIIQGIDIAKHILNPELTVIAIEDNKIGAINALQKAVDDLSRQDITIRSIPTLYPSGSAKQLIKILTGQETPIGKHANALGIVMLNVGTVFALKEAIINGKPLTSRIVTLTGDSFKKTGNFSVRLGTPVQYLLEKYGFQKQADQKLIIGGPMMGFSLSHADIPVTKICNCILAPSMPEMPKQDVEMPCIRCSDCAQACPTNLLPQQLFWYAQSKDYEKLNEYNLSACIECGNCAYVCPSSIPLVEYYRIAKSEIWTAKQDAKKTEIARQRHEKREARLEQAKQDRKAKHKDAAEKRKLQLKDKNGGEDLISAALERAKAKKAALASVEKSGEKPAIKPDLRKDAVAAVIARAKAKKAALATSESNEEQATVTFDPRKAAVAAAIARAKAKKAAIATSESNEEEATVTSDPRKAAVAAAIARAKAKKAAIATTESSDEQATVTSDPRKAAVAAAIARAKAKKAEKLAAQQITPDDVSDKNNLPNNEAVIAQRAARKEKARLQKLEKQTEQNSTSNEIPVQDERKAKIAAAVARAKAKKQQMEKD